MTNSMGKMAKVIVLFTLLFAASIAKAQTATINWANQHQQIAGFGAADQLGGGSNQKLTSAQATTFFSPTSGIGLSILREFVPEGPNTDGMQGGTGSCSIVQTSCISSGPLNNMQLAIAANPNLRIFATSFSPPAAMKTNGDVVCTAGSGNGTLITRDYGSYATWISNYIESLSSLYSINLYAVSVDNEPEYCEYYDSSLFTASDFDTFIKTNLGPTMVSAGTNGTLIMMPESSNQSNLPTYGNTTFNDSAAAAYVGIAAVHGYDFTTPTTYAIAQSAGKQYWQTEISGCATSLTTAHYVTCAYDGSMVNDALYWSWNIWGWMTEANANAWLYWALIPYGGTGYSNTGLMNADGVTIPQRLWAVGNYSKFVRPGYYRIDGTANPQKGVYISAFQDTPTETLVIVAINNGGDDVSQPFSIANSPSFTSVTPWITSASLRLAQQSAVSMSANSFSYTLPASSVTTFVASAGSPAPAPPTITSLTVH